MSRERLLLHAVSDAGLRADEICKKHTHTHRHTHTHILRIVTPEGVKRQRLRRCVVEPEAYKKKNTTGWAKLWFILPKKTLSSLYFEFGVFFKTTQSH